MRLTDQQNAAVQHRDGAALVIAGPGSGKTHVLVHRAAALIDSGVAAERILTVTFTRKSAANLRYRVKKLTQGANVSVGTFHSIGFAAIKDHYAECDFDREPTLWTERDALDALRDVRRDFTDAPDARDLAAMFSAAINRGAACARQDIADAYRAYKRECCAVDFDDLLTMMLSLCEGFAPDIFARWDYVMVDEYQDTNPLQSKIALSLSPNIMVVGDDSQSIYAFRGADIENILQFQTIYPDAAIFRLTENFRSHDGIVSVANNLIAAAAQKLEKVLTSNRTGVAPRWYLFADQRAEAAAVIKWIQKTAIPRPHIAVLYRSNFLSTQIDAALTAAQIPFRKVNGVKFLESKSAQDILAVARCAVNPTDKIAWMRVLQLFDGVGQATAFKFLIDFSGDPEILPERFASLRTCLTALPDAPRAALERIIAWYRSIEERERADAALTLLPMSEGYATLREMLSELSLSDDTEEVDMRDAITLSTIHAAKGLEWEAVLVIGVYDGGLPSDRNDIEEERRLFYVACTRAQERLIITTTRRVSVFGNHRDVKPSPFFEESGL
jgi:DNA helicase-2/ATP-dependent DNA helicase PcrA